MSEYRKAIIGGVAAFLTALTPALADGSVSALEWVGIAAATVVAFGAVWVVPNAPSETPTQATRR